jgi:hypothetical protein
MASLKRLLSRMTLLDGIIIAGLLAGIGFSFVHLGQQQPGSRVVVEQDGRVLFSGTLDQDREIPFHGPIGETVLVIHKGVAFILRSDCRDKVCMRMGEISRVGQWIACVPNRLLIRIAGDPKRKEQDYDILSR